MKMNQLLVGLLAMAALIEAISHHQEALRTEWQTWKKLHGRSYPSKKEESKRLRAYVKNSIFIANHNLEAFNGKHTYYLKMNQFGDMLHNEFLAKFVGKGKSSTDFTMKANISDNVLPQPPQPSTMPREVDWRSRGAVTPVMDQGDCPHCSHYFAIIGAAEGLIFNKSGKLIPLSVQDLIDCDPVIDPPLSERDWRDTAASLYFIRGIESQETYPYHGKKIGKHYSCKFDKNHMVAYFESGYYVTYGEANAAKKLAERGPLANFMNASPRSFQFYSEGVYSDPKCSNDPDHLTNGALIVGYGVTEDQQNYWTVKNSWGTSWGEGGYIRMAKDKNNTCGVALMVGGMAGVHLTI